MTKVPYRDIVQAVNDLAEDRLQVYSASYAILRPQREAGRITVLAQMGRERAPSLPDIPTGIEAGSRSWRWTAMSACLPARPWRRALVERIGNDVVAVSKDKMIEDKLNATAQTPSLRRREGVRRSRSRANAPRSPRSPKRSISSRRGEAGVTDARLAAGRPQLDCLEAQHLRTAVGVDADDLVTR